MKLKLQLREENEKNQSDITNVTTLEELVCDIPPLFFLPFM